MKKVLAIILSAALLITALAVNVVAATEPVTQTVSATFKAYSTGNQYDTLKPVEVGSGIQFRTSEPGVGHIDITGLIEQVTDLENVTSISVTFEAVGKEAFASREDGGNAIIGLKGVYNDATNYDIAPTNWGTNQTPYTMSGNLLDGTAAVYIDTSSHGAIPQEEPWEFKVTVAVTYTPQGKVRIGDEYFDTLVEAVDAAQSGDTIYLLDNLEGAGIGIFAADGDVKDFTIDFGGFTYTCVGPAVGSTGTQSQAFHLEKGADYTPNVTFKNGTITAETGVGVKMLIQNYCNLTLTNMNLIGTTDTQYVLSNNFGNTVIDGNTSITATAGNVAFDVCYANGPYAEGVSVAVDTTGTIIGDIELGVWNAAGAGEAPDINDYLENANLIINNVELQGEIINNVGGFNDYEPDNAGGTDEENKAEYNEKLQKAIDINGGTFAAGSKVENYLPEGGYKTDAAGNIIVGKKNDSNRITGCIYLNEDYHALIVNGRFIAQPHADNGSGFCTACKGVIVADTAE